MRNLLGILDNPSTIVKVVIFLVVVLLAVLFFRLVRAILRRTGGAPPKLGKSSLKGTVRQFMATNETSLGSRGFLASPNAARDSITRQVWRFMLERVDDHGNNLPFIPVEMKGVSLSGFIAEGNVVEIFERAAPGYTLTPHKIYNHTANTWVQVTRYK